MRCIESIVVRRQEDNPHEECGGHTDEDIPRLVIVLRQLPTQIANDGTDQNTGDVDSEWEDKASQWWVTVELNVLLRCVGHQEGGV